MALDTQSTDLNTMLATDAMNLLGNPMMVADADLKIQYVNDAALGMFAAIEADIRKDLPNFRAKEVLGKTIDVFHKNPMHQRAILDGLRAPHQGKFTIGGKNLAFRASPKFDDAGNLLLILVEWQDQTEILRDKWQLETLIQRVSAMAERHVQGFINDFIEVRDLDDVYGQVGRQVNEMVQDHIATKKKIITCMNSFSKGAFDAPFDPLTGDRQFINEAIEDIRSAFTDVVDEIERLSDAIVSGDFDQTLQPDSYSGAYKRIIQSFARSFDGLNQRFGDIRNQTATTNRVAETVSQTAQSLASLSQQQSAALDQISSSIEETDASTRANSTAAKQISNFASETRQIGESGKTQVEAMHDSMQRIENASQDISKIIKVIDEIAFQTNLLALNAAVEAARAGSHGRGFAVVAQEVRNLAGRSAKAASETSTLIESAGQQISQGAGIAVQTREAFEQIVEKIKGLEDRTSEIANASEQQAKGVSQISKALAEIAKTSQSASTQSEDLARNAGDLDRSSKAVTEVLDALRLRQVQQAPNGLPFDPSLLTQQQLQQLFQMQNMR